MTKHILLNNSIKNIKMKLYKKSEEAFGWSTIVVWALIIAIGIILIIILFTSTKIGHVAYEKIKDVVSFT